MIAEDVRQKVKPGIRIRVHEMFAEGDKKRSSVFEGIVIARKHGSEAGASFTVRATVAGVGVEKVYPLFSPVISKAQILQGVKKIHRSKLYYLRDLSKKQTRKKLKIS